LRSTAHRMPGRTWESTRVVFFLPKLRGRVRFRADNLRRSCGSIRLLFRSGMDRARPFSLVELCRGSAVILILACAGCGSGGINPSAPRPLPPMPTMEIRSASAGNVVSEPEIVASASRFASLGDVTAALQELERVQNPKERARLGAEVVLNVAGPSPSSAAALALRLPPGAEQNEALKKVVVVWTKRDPTAALLWAVGISESTLGSIARRAVADESVRSNAEAAMIAFRALPVGPRRDEMLGYGIAAWTRLDADRALAWLRKQPDNELRQDLTRSAAFELAQRAPDRAVALAESLPPGRNRWLVFSAIAQTWVAKDQKASLTWASRLPASEAREAAFAGINTGLGVGTSLHPASAPVPFTIDSGRASNIGANQAENNSPAFAAWLATQPRTMSHDEAILEFVRQRGASDLGAVGNVVAALPDASVRQRAIDIYFDQALRNSPANAANWLRSLPASDQSQEMIEKTARQWIQSDPQAAEAWLQETSLPAFRKEELLRQAPH
jgi:hypothetical protein